MKIKHKHNISIEFLAHMLLLKFKILNYNCLFIIHPEGKISNKKKIRIKTYIFLNEQKSKSLFSLYTSKFKECKVLIILTSPDKNF